MKRWFLGLAVVVAASATVARADVKDVLDKAVDAYGSKEDRAKYKGEKSTYTGDMALMGSTITVEGTNTTAKGKARSDVDLTVGGQKLKIKQVSDGTKAAIVVTVGTTEMKPPVSDAQQDELKLTAYMTEIMTIDGLRDEKRFTVKALPDEEVDKKKADVLEVMVVPLGKTLKLYLDKETHLVTMVRREGLIPGDPSEKKGQLETRLSEYKKIDGLMAPMKIVVTVDGADFLTAKVTDHTHLEKVDDKEFAIDD